MHMTINDVRQHFIDELRNENFTIDRTGAQTVELLGASFIADEPAIFGTPNEDYIRKEIDWYESQSTNIFDLDDNPPEAWKYTANDHGEINSNYGHLIFSDKYFSQYYQVADELIRNPDSRRAIMIYNRPSIWCEFNENGKNDFICTNAHTYYIRKNKLNVVVQMRSNDLIFGYRNDYAWAKYVLESLQQDLKFSLDVELGNIYWQVQNLHLYSWHFHLVK
jgi:thymidylate synthase